MNYSDTQLMADERVVPNQEDQLKEKILNAFKSKRLAKGFTEVLNVMALQRSMTVYLAGNLDKLFNRKYQSMKEKIANPRMNEVRLALSQKRLVYDAIKYEVSPKKKSADQPKKYFNTRIFAILEEETT